MEVGSYVAELRKIVGLSSYDRARIDAAIQFLTYDREPVQRQVIELGPNAGKEVKLGAGFWLYFKQGCGHNLVTVTFSDINDATKANATFPVQVGECFPWPFSEAIIRVPSSLTSGSVTLEIARAAVPCRFGASVQELKNRTSFMTGQKDVGAAGTAETLVAASQPVPDGHAVTIKAKVDNTGTIRIGNTKANAEPAAGVFYPLEPGETVDIAIDDLIKIWIDAEVTGEGVEFILEVI